MDIMVSRTPFVSVVEEGARAADVVVPPIALAIEGVVKGPSPWALWRLGHAAFVALKWPKGSHAQVTRRPRRGGRWETRT